MSAIPKLDLRSVESGGGWAVGERYAAVAPAADQLKRNQSTYVVAPVEQESRLSTPTVSDQAGDDGNVDAASDSSGGTFVDYDKPAAHSRPAPLVVGDKTAAKSTDPRSRPIAMEEKAAATTLWHHGEVVSTLELQQPVRAMDVVRDRIWAAVGDGPLACYVLDGCELALHQTVASVTSIRSICFVPEPAPTADSPPGRLGGDCLWCGADDGRIIIVSLFFTREETQLPNAHNGPVTHIVRAQNDRVWTLGKDRGLRLWDAASRRVIARKTLNTAPRDICLVPGPSAAIPGHAWTVGPQENCIRLWSLKDAKDERRVVVRGPADAAVTTMPQQPLSSSQEGGAIYVRQEVLSMRYHSASRSLWICLFERIVIVAVRFEATGAVTVSVTQELHLTAPNIDFVGDSTVIVIGRGGPLEGDCGHDYLAAFHVTPDPSVAPTLIHRGSLLAGVSAVGIRNLRGTPFAVVAHTNLRNVRCLSVFATTVTEAVGAWAVPGHDSAVAQAGGGSSAAVPIGRTESHQSQGGGSAVTRNSRSATPAQQQQGSAKPSRGTAQGDASPAPAEPVRRTPVHQPSQPPPTSPPPVAPASKAVDSQPPPLAPEPSGVPRGKDGDSTTSSQVPISASTQPDLTAGRQPPSASPGRGPAALSHRYANNSSFAESTPMDGNTARIVQGNQALHAGTTTNRNAYWSAPNASHNPHASPPESSARDAVARVERKVDDVARHVRRLRLSQERSLDFQALLDEVLKLAQRFDASGAPLPPVRPNVAEEIDLRFATGEGRTIAAVIARLESNVAALKAQVEARDLAAPGRPQNGGRIATREHNKSESSPTLIFRGPNGSAVVDTDDAHGDPSETSDDRYADPQAILTAFTRALDHQRAADRATYAAQMKESERQSRQLRSRMAAVTHGWARLLAELELATAVAPPPTVLAAAAGANTTASAVVADLFASDGGLGITDRSSPDSIAFAFNTVSSLLRSHILQGRTVSSDAVERHIGPSAAPLKESNAVSPDGSDDDDTHFPSRRRASVGSSRSVARHAPAVLPPVDWRTVLQLGIPHLHAVEEFAASVPDRLRLLQHSSAVLASRSSALEASGLLLLRAELFAELCGHEAVMEIAEAVTSDWPATQDPPTGDAHHDIGRVVTRSSNVSTRSNGGRNLSVADRNALKHYWSVVATASLRVDEAGHATRSGLSAQTISTLNISGLSASPDPRLHGRRGVSNSVFELRRLLADTSFPVGERSFRGFSRWMALWALCFAHYLSHVERTVHRVANATTPRDAAAEGPNLPSSAVVPPTDTAAPVVDDREQRLDALKEVNTAARRFDTLAMMERRSKFLLSLFHPDGGPSSSRGGTTPHAEDHHASPAARQQSRLADMVAVNPFAAYLHGSAHGHDVLEMLGVEASLEESLETSIHTLGEIKLAARGLQDVALRELSATEAAPGPERGPQSADDTDTLRKRLAALQVVTKHWCASLNAEHGGRSYI